MTAQMFRTISQEALRQSISYDKDTGEFRWVKNAGTKKKGAIAGCISTQSGYRLITINRKVFMAHRLAWIYEYGAQPKALIDHINRDRDDNRLLNLREATLKQNLANVVTSKSNTSGVRGVIWDKESNKWRACITVDGKQKHLGRFVDKDDAASAFREAHKNLYKEFSPVEFSAAGERARAYLSGLERTVQTGGEL